MDQELRNIDVPFELSGRFVSGAASAAAGVLFLASGAGLALNFKAVFGGDAEGLALVLLFLAVGATSFVLGMAFLYSVLLERRMAKWLVANGYVVWADVVGREEDLESEVDGRCPQRVLCEAPDPVTGDALLFRSGIVPERTAEGLFMLARDTGCKVAVFVDRMDAGCYYVALDVRR